MRMAPAGNRSHPEQEKNHHVAASPAVSSLPDSADMLQGIHVVMVAYKVAGEVRYRRRFYLNLNAAQRAVDRAVERGQAASITLCRLAPAGPAQWQSGGVL